jgi:pimeloyl-ACP methyl ester carboxylesterase
MKPETDLRFEFPVGYQQFHRDQLFNFQLNRPYSLGYARFDDLEAAGRQIRTFADWKRVMLEAATRAAAEGRLMNAAFHHRAAEFYTFPDDPDKEFLYDQFSESFYRAFESHGIERIRIPYVGTHLHALAVSPQGPPRGQIVLHGGYDSFIEEFYSLMRGLAAAGYRVIGFDGPGQGATRRKAGLPLDYRWERPVGAVLDHLGLSDVTLIGLSMGGYFALRAAALERRVTRVIASGHAYDYRKVARPPATAILVFFHDHLREFTNRLSLWKISKGGLEAWNISHLMYVLGVSEPMAALEFALELNEEHLLSDRIRQDVLILASRDDHFIPFRLHRQQLRRLSAAKSVTDRVFTKADHAENHCQIGNIGLALHVMRTWIDEQTALVAAAGE